MESECEGCRITKAMMDHMVTMLPIGDTVLCCKCNKPVGRNLHGPKTEIKNDSNSINGESTSSSTRSS